jgi:putative ABC transport system permease protein
MAGQLIGFGAGQRSAVASRLSGVRILQDVRFALRLLAKRPGFAAVAILTLSLGVGASTSIFSVVEAVLLRPLPFAEPDRLVQLTIRGADGETYPLPDTDFVAWRDENEAFSSVAVYDGGEGLALTGEGDAERVIVRNVTDRFFATLGVAPLLGRTFGDGADRPGAPKSVVLSQAFWQRHFHGDSSVIGRSVLLDGVSHTIVGVMPASFAFPEGNLDGWRILTMQPPARRGPFYTLGLARLKPGTTLERARTNLAVIADGVKRRYPGPNLWTYSLVPLREQMVGDVRRMLYLLFAAVGFLLLIATANVANLLLVRARSRTREIAVRAAIGAGRGRIVAQLVTESVVLGVLSGLAGLLISSWGTRALLAIAPEGIPRLDEVRLKGTVFAFAVGVASLCGILFGLAPALRAAGLPLVESLKEGGSSGAGMSQRRTQRALVVGEIALALILSVGAGLLIRSMAALTSVNPGFAPTELVTFRLKLPERRYDTPGKITALYDALRTRLESEPAIRSVGSSTSLPPDLNTMTDSFVAEGQQIPPNQSPPVAPLVVVDENYFKTLGVPLVAGRFFDERDAPGRPLVAIVNQTLASRYFPGGNAVGKRLKQGGAERPNNPWMEIVGVVGDVKYSGLNAPPEPAFYLADRQQPFISRFVLVRTSADPRSAIGSIRAAVSALDRDVPVARVYTIGQLMNESVAAPRFRTTLVSVFAILGLVLAAIGIYGVMAYTVSERARELCVRVALGATTRDVMRMVLGEAFALAAAGVALGVAGAAAATRLMAALLFGVTPTDPATFVSIAGILMAIALAGSYVPARRATAVDPMATLRSE